MTEEELASRVLVVVREIHKEVADDLCWLDIDRIFAAANLSIPDRRVGDKEAMHANCRRFIDTMCEGGHWVSYKELSEDLLQTKKKLEDAHDLIAHLSREVVGLNRLLLENENRGEYD